MLPRAKTSWNKTQRLLLRGCLRHLSHAGETKFCLESKSFTSASMEVCENATAQSLLSSELEAEPSVSLALDKTSLWLQAPWDHVIV